MNKGAGDPAAERTDDSSNTAAASPITTTRADRLARVRVLPKVELHCHLEGTMRGETLVEMAHVRGVPLASADPAQVRQFDGFKQFFEIFRRVQSVLQTREDWCRLAYEGVEDAAATGIRYRECFVTPARCLRAGVPLGEILAGIGEGFDAGEADFGVRSQLIVDCDRTFGPDAGSDLMDQLAGLMRAAAPGTHRVVGAGMDGPEDLDPSRYAVAFATARGVGLRLTSHQGGECPPDNIRQGLDVLGCERIDHGLTVVEDDELLKRLRDERIPVTVCPTSNLSVGRFSSLQEHPFGTMRARGLLATIHTDDPTFVGNDLSTEYDLIAETLGLSWPQVVSLACDAVESSWMDDDSKATLRAEMDAASSHVTTGLPQDRAR